ncbi:hypothetical protein Lnau_0250 [Legionella nautarum]|uniref:Uncharacterized protein n=1 Tax=Legionella nautarum TaxID=45070 RepID=A0A0W0X3P7_9GAMM|nr:hypothetical protein [Legionella nautarum]KTD39181.1 hypothetical protein Lnau_0250 [Legionella nautarum]
MKPLIKEATYIYTYPPRISIRWANDTTTVYSWTSYPSQPNLSDFGPLFHYINCVFYPINYQLIPHQITFRGKPRYIEDITYVNTLPPSIAIRWNCGLTDFYSWTNFPYPQNVEHFKPWFPWRVIMPKALKALPSEEKTSEEVFDSFFTTDPKEIVCGPLDVPEGTIRRDDAFSSQSSDMFYPAPEDMSSDEIFEHNIRNYQPNPNLPIPYNTSIAQKLEIAARTINSYSNSRFLYFNRHQNTTPRENLPHQGDYLHKSGLST